LNIRQLNVPFHYAEESIEETVAREDIRKVDNEHLILSILVMSLDVLEDLEHFD